MTRPQVDTSKLEAIASFVESLGGTHSVVIEAREQRSLDLATYLANAGRDFFSVTDQMRSDVAAEMVNAAQAMPLKPESSQTLMELGAQAARRVILRRFETGGYDVGLKPLSPAYAAFKRRHSYLYDQRVGIATGRLYRDVKLSTFSIRKTSA